MSPCVRRAALLPKVPLVSAHACYSSIALSPPSCRASVLENFRLEDEALAALRRRQASLAVHDRPSPLVTPRVLSATAGGQAAEHAAAVAAATDFERTATV